MISNYLRFRKARNSENNFWRQDSHLSFPKNEVAMGLKKLETQLIFMKRVHLRGLTTQF